MNRKLFAGMVGLILSASTSSFAVRVNVFELLDDVTTEPTTGLTVQKERFFGNTHLHQDEVKNLNDRMRKGEDVVHVLKTFVDVVSKQSSGKAIYVQLPAGAFGLGDKLIEAGFEFFTGTTNFHQWVVKNEFNLPDPHTHIIVDRSFVFVGNEVLFLTDKNNPQSTNYRTPGGFCPANQASLDGLSKTISSETGINLLVNDFSLVGLINAPKQTKNGRAENTMFYMSVLNAKPEVKMDETQFSSYKWIPVEDALAGNVKMSDTTKKMLQHAWEKLSTESNNNSDTIFQKKQKTERLVDPKTNKVTDLIFA